jgi:pyruvate/2-oxoacid:ferredoxin oxidoreductase alpha subunit
MAVTKESKQEQRVLMTGNEAVAEAVRLARPKVIPTYPITPQTSIVESLAKMSADGLLDTEYITMESEHSVMSAAIGASLAGCRTFTATSSHGLLYMGEMIYWAGMTRIPMVLAVVNRSLNPWNIWVDHQDSMAFRDAGWIQFYAKNNQEVLDLTLIAFKVAEHHKVWMPVMVCLDGFVLSHTSSLVSVPSNEIYDEFIKDFEPLIVLNNEKPFAHGALTGSEDMTALRFSLMDGFESAKKVFSQVNKEFQRLVNRDFGGMLEITGDKEAKVAVMALGTIGEELEAAIDYLDEKIAVKGIRPRVFRPFPKEEIIKELETVDKVLILDRAVSFGSGGQLAIEVKAALFDANNTHTKIIPKIVGLGGLDVNFKDIAKDLADL